MTGTLTFLGLESSCDDTAAAVIRHSPSRETEFLGSVVVGQGDLHARFGGIVPEIAARAHAERLDGCAERALEQAELTLNGLDAIAVTAGPGLIGGLMAGVAFAKGLALGSGLPLVGVNHLAGHALTARMLSEVNYPYLALLVSGGHCQFLAVLGPDEYIRLGGTIDDAPGETFDKVARMLGLESPGGPAVEEFARLGDSRRFSFPLPLRNRPNCNFSFSGLKTAVRCTVEELSNGRVPTKADVSDICASFQRSVAEVIGMKSNLAIQAFTEIIGRSPEAFAPCGGVAANRTVRSSILAACTRWHLDCIVPDPRYCTDNAEMIAYAGIELFRTGCAGNSDIKPRARWPLDTSSPALLGSGKRGAKS